MPRAAAGPRLVLYGPDTKHGAKARKGFSRYVWYVKDTVDGREVERSTGAEFVSQRVNGRREAETFLSQWIASKPVAKPKRGAAREPDELRIGEVLGWYCDEHALTVKDGSRIAYAVEALAPFWGDLTVADVTRHTRRQYCEQRNVERRDPATGTPVVVRQASPGTLRRELSTLDAACRYAVGERRLKWYPEDQWLPPMPEPRDRWLTRKEAAALLRAAWRQPKARHLCTFILIALYMGLRKEAILSLQWQPNTEGGWVDLERGIIEALPMGAVQSKKRRPRSPMPLRLWRHLERVRNRTRQFVIEAERPERTEDGQNVMGFGAVANVKRSFASACIAAGVESGLCEPKRDAKGRVVTDADGFPVLVPTATPHTLKHTCITWLLQSGVEIWEVAGFVDTTVETIQRTYGHHAAEYMDRAANSSRGKEVQQAAEVRRRLRLVA